MASNSAAELAQEQAYVTMLYERLDVLRAAMEQRLAAVRLGPTAENEQGWSERESFAQLYQDRGAELDAAERNLCFGRLDFDDGDRFYIGRLGLRNDDHDQLLVDWCARAAEPFYRATPRERCGVTRRRHLYTAGRRVVSLDDDVLDLDAVDETHLTGEAALLASLRRGRTGRMSDIVATIQADQDRIIREDLGGILVVEGGPGTGKTVVALHRAAYLLYTHRKRLARRGILIIGPSATFLRYIDQVLPSLGENDVVLATIGSLFPGVDARSPESPRAAQVKGGTGMAAVLAKAVADLRQVPAAAIEIKIDAVTYRLTPRLCRQARAEAERRRDPDTGAPLPHNTARRAFIKAVVRKLARQRVRDLGGQRILPPGDEEDLRADLAAAPALRSVLDVLCRSSRRGNCSRSSTSNPAGLTSPTTSAPRSPATRHDRGRPPTCRCSTNWRSSSVLSTPRCGRPGASAPPTRPSARRRSRMRRSSSRSSSRTRPSWCPRSRRTPS